MCVTEFRNFAHILIQVNYITLINITHAKFCLIDKRNVPWKLSESLQCYSCKATGTNELDANIKCLEKAYLENCEEFYDYYNEIEDQDVISYEYYYYDKEDDKKDSSPVNSEVSKKTNELDPVRPSTRSSSQRRNKRAVEKKKKEKDTKKDENEVYDEDYKPEYYYEYEYIDDNVTSTEPSKFNDLDISVEKSKDKNDRITDVKKYEEKSKNKMNQDPQVVYYFD